MTVPAKTYLPTEERKAAIAGAATRNERIEMAVLGALAVGTSLVFLAPIIGAAL